MRNLLGNATLAVTLCFGCAASLSSANAATLSGDSFDVSLYYPNRSTLYQDVGNFVDNNTYTTNPLDPKGQGRLGPSSIRYIFGQTHTFKAAPFDGIVFTDQTKSIIANAGLNHSTTAMGLTASDVLHTADSISLNLSGVTVQAGTVIQIDIATSSVPKSSTLAALAVPSVPLPGAAPMFGAALMMLAGFRYGLNRRVAPHRASEAKA